LIIITHWKSLTDTSGYEEAIAWNRLFERFQKTPQPFRGDMEHPGWSPAKFDPCARLLENVKCVYGICLDYDKGESIEAARAIWKGCYGLIHTTRKHTPMAQRFRVILAFSRPVTADEYYELWKRIDHHAGGKLDKQPKDPSRFWFTPGPDAVQNYTTCLLEGAPLDPDKWLSKELPVITPPPAPPRPVPTNDAGKLERRAIAYIERMPEAVSGSGGHAATWNVARKLASDFGLDETTTFELMRDHYNPRCQPPWSEKELRHKASDAVKKARVSNPITDRHWDIPSDHYEFDEAEPDEAPADDGYRGDFDAEHPTAQAPTKTAAERYGLLSMQDLMQMVVSELNKPRPRMGAATGHYQLDSAIGGYRHGNVTVFGAKRGFGKTSYGNMVTGLAVPRLNVIMFAGEDAAAMYGKRFLAEKAQLNAMMLRDYRCNAEDWPRITQALASAPTNPFFVRVEGRPVEWMAKVVADMSKEQPVDLVIVDYLQKIKTEKKLQDRRNEVTYVTATLHDAVKRANASGLFFSQLKRTERLEPEVEDLKESGDIEDMADHIILGWKVDGGNGDKAQRMVKIAKNKDGTEASEIAEIELEWDQRTASFIPSKDKYDEFDVSDNRYQ
jgi:hypothetical protein